MRNFVRTNNKAAFALALLILVLIDVAFLWNSNRLSETSRHAENTRLTISLLDRLHLYKEDAESEQLGYLLTGERGRLDTYRSNLAIVNQALRDLRVLTRDSPFHRQRLDALTSLLGAGVDQLDAQVAARDLGGAQAALAIAGMDAARQTMDDVDDVLSQMQAEERERLAQWDREQELDARSTTVVAIMGSILAALLVAVALLAVNLDVAELRRARDSQARLVAILDAAPDFVGIANTRGQVIYFNRSGRLALGMGEDEDLGGPPISSFHPPWAASLVLEKGIPAALTEGTWTGETALLTRDGREIPVSQHIIAHRDALGSVDYTSTILRDITALKETEAHLRWAKEAAEAASRAKSDFLAMMSHEIRTPMNVILGVNDLLRESSLTDRQREQLDVARSAGEILLKLIDDILDLSGIEAGRFTLEEDQFDLRGLLEEECRLMGVQARRKGVELRYGAAPDVPLLLLGDRRRLRQVMMNLLSNAVKFTDGGLVSLEVTMRDSDPEPAAGADSGVRHLLVSVSDTGVGISPEKLGAVFESFTQADSSVTRRYGGTGLGLTIAKRIVELMGGRIWVESRPDHGSTFFFTLPVRVVANPGGAALAPVPITSPAPTAPGPAVAEESGERGLRILLAEDSAQNRWLIASYLEGTPHSLDFAENGEIALDRFKAGAYDLVLMDLQMPVMDGFSATRAIRRWEGQTDRPRTPVVAVSAYAMPEEVEEMLDAGCDAHLAKPVRKAALLEVLHRGIPGVPVGAPSLGEKVF